MTQNHHKFCIAPMMKKTDKHFRFMVRQFTKNSMLYTEMIHSVSYTHLTLPTICSV